MSKAARSVGAAGPHSSRLSQAKRREQLLYCALKVFAEHGLETSNHTLVAAEAGVSVPLCFFYFKSRAALLDAVLGEVENLYKAAFALADRDDLDASEALKSTSDALIATLRGGRHETRIFIDWSVAVRSPIWPRFLRLHRHLVAVLARVIARGQRQGVFRAGLDPADEAELLHAASFALAQLRMAGAGPSRIERFRQSMMKRIQFETVAAPDRCREPARAVVDEEPREVN